MSEAYHPNWALGSHFGDRDRFHDVALHEARVASERRATTPTAAAPSESLLSRLRLAFGRPVAVDRCDCPAAA